MTQALSGAAIAAVIAVCWLLGRPRPKLLRSTDASGVAALNRQQMERVLESGDGPLNPDEIAAGEQTADLAIDASFGWPRSSRERVLLLAQLEAQFRQGGAARHQAMTIAAAWGHRAALPLLRRGLRDTNPEVVALAASAMGRFRGTTAPAAQPAAKAPRNVSRTR